MELALISAGFFETRRRPMSLFLCDGPGNRDPEPLLRWLEPVGRRTL